MSRPKGTFADRLDEYLENATEDEARGIASSLAVWARVRKFAFRVKIEPVKMAETPLLDQEAK